MSVRIPSSELRDDLLVLRAWNPDSEGDVAAMFAGVTDTEFTRWNTPNQTIASEAEAAASLRRRQAQQRDGKGVGFCITDGVDGTILGHVALNAIDWHMLRAQVAFWLLPIGRGRRLSARALGLVSQWAFETLGLHRLELYHAIGNEPSCRTAERCGYAYEGVLRDRMFASGDRDRFRDAHLHARLATDAPPKT